MSVKVMSARPPLAGAFYDDFDKALQAKIDWGTVTPVNTLDEVDGVKLEDDFGSAVFKRGTKHSSHQISVGHELPRKQKALLLHAVRESFQLKEDHQMHEIENPDDLVVRIKAIGLNPIDWKSVDYGYGIPHLPYVSGRDFAGTIVKAPSMTSHLRVGDTVLCPSTDYRDLRKAAFQEYAIASHSTVCRIPQHVSVSQGAALGVAYVAAALALGICLGLRIPHRSKEHGIDLLRLVRETPLGRLPPDVVPECLAIEESERARTGDWLVVWGGSSTSALFLSQIARLAGLRVILVVDVAKHGARLTGANGCICIDSHDSERAVDVIRGMTGNGLRLAIDTVGKQTAEHLARCFPSERNEDKRRPQLVGLAALPKERLPGVVYHSVPVKLFHEVPSIGSSLMTWLEDALEHKRLDLPHVEEAPGGLGGINDALDRMRQGQISGKRLVVPI
ncbi:Alcohol dehydrogenase superfamily, zinc-type [Lecanosticta acicola]|uniref:Alcohol dehydrogenase superfamily, zinc-type n=1 Tax=Lecanosticta acicola TaxID=111012 RepID=A0AAI9E6P6_9PEZI|nr:Alcohol dehydrogenase superfamily, zinc-type [Lecanosticta acicola]